MSTGSAGLAPPLTNSVRTPMELSPQRYRALGDGLYGWVYRLQELIDLCQRILDFLHSRHRPVNQHRCYNLWSAQDLIPRLYDSVEYCQQCANTPYPGLQLSARQIRRDWRFFWHFVGDPWLFQGPLFHRHMPALIMMITRMQIGLSRIQIDGWSTTRAARLFDVAMRTLGRAIDVVWRFYRS